MKKHIIAVVFLIIIASFAWFTTRKTEKYEVVKTSNCAPGYIQSCISVTIPGGASHVTASSNVCPESYFEMCIPDAKYQLVPENVCPPGYGIHPATSKCAPLSAIKVFKLSV
jgi:hypothetical protein